jgi:hypothetical protein
MNIKHNRIFNIYYINFAKVYEISMMINNVITTSIQRENSIAAERFSKTSASASYSQLNSIKSKLTAETSYKSFASSKMIETLDVKTTKSTLLREIYNKCKNMNTFKDCEVGDLIKVEDVALKIHNEENLREFKLFRSDALAGLKVEGVDIGNIFNSMLKDYSYLLKSEINPNETLIIKIPMELENEFDSNYNVDDLTLGKVSIIGIYKGSVEEEQINLNTLNYLMDLDSKTSDPGVEKVVRSTIERLPTSTKPKTNGTFLLIDIIAVIQDIKYDAPEVKSSLWQRLKNIINGLLKRG